MSAQQPLSWRWHAVVTWILVCERCGVRHTEEVSVFPGQIIIDPPVPPGWNSLGWDMAGYHAYCPNHLVTIEDKP